MKFTLAWLKDHLETDASLGDIVSALTRVGLEVEGVTNPADALRPFRVAQILTAEPHPRADKLQVLTVDTNEGAPVQVVCGAPNARAGLKSVFGPPGATVPGNGMVLKVAAIRGVESRGMMCSARELELGEGHDGIIELPADAQVGTAFADHAGIDDPVIDISVNPNRPDAMGVYGIARDLAAAGLGRLLPLDASPVEGTFPCPVEIRIEDEAGCPAFNGRVIRGVRNGPSPDWLQRRLEAVGQRPISALVDITNYLSIGYGRPLHVYDLAKLTGAVVARRARNGETVAALNGKTYALDDTMTVIADAAGVHDIGGIMGGAKSGVSETTTDVLIECAYFDPASITRTGQKLALSSDARTRFERGVDPAFLDPGLEIATGLALDLVGGTASDVMRVGIAPAVSRDIAYDPAHCLRLAGLDIPAARQAATLAALGFHIEQGEVWRVTPPSWRHDVEGAADIVEEVVRIEGLDSLPSTPLPRIAGAARPTATVAQVTERRLRRTAAARGLHEAVTWSFIAEPEAQWFGGGPWRVANPISEELRVMRPSLLPGLLAAARRNQARGSGGIRLFELGRRYLAEGERPTCGLLFAGERAPRHWRSGRAEPVDLFDAKAEALALLAAAGAPTDNVQVEAGAGEHFHPGRSGQIRLGKAVLATFGELHPRVLRAFDVSGAVAAAELFLDAVPARRASRRAAYAPPPLQPVRRDFAFLLAEDVAADQLLRTVRGADKSAITGVSLFDVFTGSGVPAGERSLAVEVVLQPGEKSLTEDELKAIADRIVTAAAKIGARLRD